MIMALPHLPPQRGQPHDARTPEAEISDGIQAIRNYILEKNILQLNVIIEYVERFWMLRVGPHNFSTFSEPRRTNNSLESFHSRLVSLMGNHPNIWSFIRTLLKLSNKSSTEARAVLNGRLVRGSQRVNNNTLMVRKATRMLLTGQYTTMTFLRYVSHSVDGLIRVFGHPQDDTEEDNPEENIPQPEFQDVPEEPAHVDVQPGAVPEPAGGQTQGNRRDCMVCKDAPSTHIIMPCAHLGLCQSCLDRLQAMRGRCPYCRGEVTNYQQFFEV